MLATPPTPADPLLTATFYRFVALPDARPLSERLRERCEALDIRGTIVLAEEGINATVAGTTQSLRSLLQWLRADVRLADLACTALPCRKLPFQRLKIKVKREIVTFGVGALPTGSLAGRPVAPTDWNALLDQAPGLVLIDTRNAFEVAAGSFPGAVDPGIAAFSELPQWIEQQQVPGGLLAGRPPVAMFCTGGIRCEKSTTLLRARGFAEVYQLRGGILRYLAEIASADNRWRGDCFVFDERVVVQAGMQATSIG